MLCGATDMVRNGMVASDDAWAACWAFLVGAAAAVAVGLEAVDAIVGVGEVVVVAAGGVLVVAFGVLHSLD